jgi:hypothetical protein
MDSGRDRSPMHAYQDLAYAAGARSSQKLDLYLPDRGIKLPLVA